MCGIFGAVERDCVQKTIDALHFLEYRGYDSAGICVAESDGLHLFKTQGRVSALEDMLPSDLLGTSAIGHTRWATHGEVSNCNAHPFLSGDGTFAICHNGILDNFAELKANLQKSGAVFSSETDSETIAHLLQHNFVGDGALESVLKTAKMLRGAFAVLVQTSHESNTLFAIKNKNPLAVGLSQNGDVYFCSDVRCIAKWAVCVAVVPDNTVVRASRRDVRFFDFDGKEKQIKFFAPRRDLSERISDLGGDMMLNEIFEIPERLACAKSGYFETGGLGLSSKTAKTLSRIYLLGCGTAYNSGLEAAAVARNFCNVDLFPVVASEFLYDNYPVDSRTLAFCISQSGETADTVRAAEKVKNCGGIVYAVTNTEVSQLGYCCDCLKNVFAGGEYAVASTKAYNCQLQTLLLLLTDICVLRGELSRKKRAEMWDDMSRLPLAVDKILCCSDIAETANRLKNSSAVFFLGRTADYPTAVEGSLKLKEISYLHSEAYPCGELKHGTLALMEQGVSVVIVSTDVDLVKKTFATASEVASRKADVITISPYGCGETCILLPTVHRFLYGIVSVVPLQLLAYHTAKALGRDVDKPRNLAKSVTVE